MILRKLRPAPILGLAAVAALPLAVHLLFPGSEKYYLHLLIQILLWSFIYTSWSLMGRFGLTSLGHGAFTGIGAYTNVVGHVFEPMFTLIFVLKTLFFALAVSIIPMASGLNNVEGDGSRETAALQGLVRMFGVLLVLEAVSLMGNYI